MIELGNLMFGNSRGEFPVPRTDDYYSQLIRLFEAVDPKRDSSWREYGMDFQNDTFSIMPYYWGDCQCGYDDAEWAWSAKNKHQAECYQAGYCALATDPQRPWSVKESDARELCAKHGIPWDGGRGSAVHCTCDFEKRWAEFCAENSHKETCPLVIPNFHYKTTDFRLKWYKYPLRDSYMNQKISPEEFSAIIDKCIASLTPPPRQG